MLSEFTKRIQVLCYRRVGEFSRAVMTIRYFSFVRSTFNLLCKPKVGGDTKAIITMPTSTRDVACLKSYRTLFA